jgi:hypothetical protein
MSVRVYIDAVGMLGPGADNWPQWQQILQWDDTYQATKTVLPALDVLPPAERRRVGASVRLALSCGMQALNAAQIDPAGLTTVFSSSGGDGDNCSQICETLASQDRLISPTRFHNSVHNAPSGYWGIASGAMLPSTSISAYDASFAAGLLEAAVQCAVGSKPVLLLAYDSPYPEPLQSARPIADQFAVALLLAPQANSGSIVGIEIAPSMHAGSRMNNPALEQVRLGIPAARCLPLMQHLARLPDAEAQATDQHIYLDYLNGQTLGVKFFAQ